MAATHCADAVSAADELRVLLIDDDRDFADGLYDLLEPRGYRIDVAYTAEEARRRLADFDAQVALVDVRLGAQSGVDLARELKRIRPDALCVMVTAHADLHNTIASLQEGVFDFLRKPFEPAELFVAMDRCAQRIRLQREKAEVEAQREKLIAKLEAQNAELERFTYTVSHDLKSPLFTIKGYVGMLSEDLAEANVESVEDDLLRISNAADKMAQLLADLLELSRIGRSVNPPEDVPLGELANEALQLVRGQIEQRSVQVELSSDLPVAFGDRTRLLEVLQNLIDNAVKYMGDQPHPRIEIGDRRDGDQTVCYVRDNGLGIEHRYHERVFGLFDQLDPKVEGSGIGLALVKRIVEVHGGRIWVESEGSGHGSTFCFTIPARTESEEIRPCGTVDHGQRCNMP